MNRDSDTHPEGGNSVQHEVPFMGSAGRLRHRPDYIAIACSEIRLNQLHRNIRIMQGNEK